MIGKCVKYHNLRVVDGEVLVLLVEASEVNCLDVVNVDQVGNGGRLVEELVEDDLWLGDWAAWHNNCELIRVMLRCV